MDIVARHHYSGTGARKVRKVTRLLPGQTAQSALELLRVMPHIGARLTRKVLASAVANAEHNHQISSETLFVKSVIVNDAPRLRRFKPRAFGRGDTMERGSSHIIVTVSTVPPAPKKSSIKKAARIAKKTQKDTEMTKDTHGS